MDARAAGAVLALLTTVQAATAASTAPAETLANLGTQLEVGEYAAVATGAEQLVASIEARAGRYDSTLVAALTLLGDAQMGLDDPESALAAYDRAKHILRIGEGVQGLSQIELLYREADALIAMGDRPAANDRHEFAYSLEARRYGREAPELIPATYRLIEWYEHNYKFRPAQVLYEQVIETAKKIYPPTDRRIIDAVRGYARTYRQRRFGSREPGRGGFLAWPPGHPKDPPWYNRANFRRGKDALKEVLELTRNAPDMSNVEVATAMVEYADWNLLYYKPRPGDELLPTRLGVAGRQPGAAVGGVREAQSAVPAAAERPGADLRAARHAPGRHRAAGAQRQPSRRMS